MKVGTIGVGIMLAAFALPSAAAARDAQLSSPGVMIESAPLSSEYTLADAGRAVRILYTSTDGVTGQGTIPVSGAVFLPKGKAPRRGWPIVAWAHGTRGVADACAPSRSPRSARDATYLNSWLREGYAVVATDYQGLGTPGPHFYLNTRSEAYSVLDSVRASLKSNLPVANQVLIVGQSQGGGAAFATAAEASDYAPDVKVLGTVATGVPYMNALQATPRDLDSVDRTIAYGMFIVASALAADPTLRADVLLKKPAGILLLALAQEHCTADIQKAIADAGLTRRAVFSENIATKYAEYLRGTTYRTLHVPTPVFVGTGGKDIDVPTLMQFALVRDACAAGTPIVHHVYEELDHSGAVNPSFADSRLFARALLKGQRVATTCPSVAR